MKSRKYTIEVYCAEDEELEDFVLERVELQLLEADGSLFVDVDFKGKVVDLPEDVQKAMEG